MNLTRQPLFKDAHNLFRFGRGQLSNTYAMKHGPSRNQLNPQSGTDVESELSMLYSVGVDRNLYKARLATKNRVENAIHKKFGSTSYRVEFFGSVRYGVSHPNSDLDMVVIDYQAPQGAKKRGKEPIYSLRVLARALVKAGFTKVIARDAVVPIVKFRDPISGLDCDINVNERMGIHNSTLIKEYCDAHPHLRPLLFYIKEWAKPLGLNHPANDGKPISFSSYAFALMTISFLQKQGHLPNLQEHLHTKEDKKKLIWTRKPHKGWDVRFRSARHWVPPTLPDFDTMLPSWFSYWIDFPYETESISIRHGGTTPRSGVPKHVRKNKKKPSGSHVPIHVGDPFILTKNVTAAIAKKTYSLFIKECQNQLIKIGPPMTTGVDLNSGIEKLQLPTTTGADLNIEEKPERLQLPTTTGAASDLNCDLEEKPERLTAHVEGS